MSEEKPIDKLPCMPFAIQLTNIHVQKISAERSMNAWQQALTLNANYTIAATSVEGKHGFVMLEVQVEGDGTILAITLVGTFYSNGTYTDEEFTAFLQKSSLSLMLPFAREAVFDLSRRMQLTQPIMLSTMAVQTDKKEN